MTTENQQQPEQVQGEPLTQAQYEEQQRKIQVAQYKERRGTLETMLKNYEASFKQALPKFLTPERMIRTALTAMSRTPDLMACTNISIMSSLMTCAQLGLMPDAIIGEAYLIPFNNTKKKSKECTVIIGYKGLCALAFRSGQVKSIQARAVYQGDVFEYELGLNEVLKHIPQGETDPSKITHFYAIVKLTTGGHVFNVMTRKEVEAVRNESKAYSSAYKKEETIWAKYFGDMGCKTVLRRLMKFVPLSPELQRAIGLDELADVGKQSNPTDFIDMVGDMQFTEDAVAEVLENDEIEGQEQKTKSADDHKGKAADAAQSTLDLLKDKDKKAGK